MNWKKFLFRLGDFIAYCSIIFAGGVGFYCSVASTYYFATGEQIKTTEGNIGLTAVIFFTVATLCIVYTGYEYLKARVNINEE